MKTMKRLFIGALLPLPIVAGALVWANQHENPLPAEARADLLVLEKSKRQLTLYRDGQPLKTYPVALGRQPVGAKQEEGDRKTPEGNYLIDYRNAGSGYFRSMHISYPAAADREAARQRGVSPGGDIMIHGLRNGVGWMGKLHRLADWTLGCVALTNAEMEELWRAVPNGTPIELRP